MQSSKEFLSEIFNIIKNKGKIDDEFIIYLDTIFKERSYEILEIIRKGVNIYRYKPSDRALWIAVGQTRIYYLYPKIYCSCHDFYKTVITKRSRNFCKHLIAQVIVEALESYEIVYLEDDEFGNLIEDLTLEDNLCWGWSSNKPQMHHYAAHYFTTRLEDGLIS